MVGLHFNSITELIKAFPTQEVCIKYLEQRRWNGAVVSPFATDSTVYKCPNNRYKCRSTNKYFNVCTGTMFDNTKIDLQTWFVAIYLITSHKKGISSIQLAKDLGVTQKTAWHMNHRIRNCFGMSNEKLGGDGEIVEADETFFGGKESNKHAASKEKKGKVTSSRISKTGTSGKMIIVGMVQRNESLKMIIVADRDTKTLTETIRQNVQQGTRLITDGLNSYVTLRGDYIHESIKHTLGDYRTYGDTHTNNIEGIFSLFDRMVIGIYHWFSKKHLQRYLSEFCFRYNTRTASECTRFDLVFSNFANKLTYQTLIAK